MGPMRRGSTVVIVKISDIDKSEGLSGQILLLRRKAECTGLRSGDRLDRCGDRSNRCGDRSDRARERSNRA